MNHDLNLVGLGFSVWCLRLRLARHAESTCMHNKRERQSLQLAPSTLPSSLASQSLFAMRTHARAVCLLLLLASARAARGSPKPLPLPPQPLAGQPRTTTALTAAPSSGAQTERPGKPETTTGCRETRTEHSCAHCTRTRCTPTHKRLTAAASTDFRFQAQGHPLEVSGFRPRDTLWRFRV